MKNFRPDGLLFIIIIALSSLWLFYEPGHALAQSFAFRDSASGAAVTGDFTLLKNSAGRISYPQAYQGRLWFAEPVTLEKPAYTHYTFLSDKYAIDNARTPAAALRVLKGEMAAGPSSLYVIYLKAGTSLSSGPAQALPAVSTVRPDARYNFGGAPYAPSGGGLASQTTRPQASVPSQSPAKPASNSQPQISNRTISYSGNSFGGARTVNPYTGTWVQTGGTTGGATATTNGGGGAAVTVTGGGGQTGATNTVNAINTTAGGRPGNAVVNNGQGNSTQGSSGTRGGVAGYISGGATPFGGGSVVVSVTNSNNQIMGSQVVNTEPGVNTIYPYTITGIPTILPGSNDYYRIVVTSNNGFLATQYPQSNFKVYSNSHTVYTQPIVMQARTGRVSVTLYHGPPGIGETEAELSTLARNAVVMIAGTGASARFSGESPARFYRYVIDEAPAGQRTLDIMFPGHRVNGNATVTVQADSSVSALFNLGEGQ